jgi:alpha-tubulin suppressor-like RCC1 family protein
MVHKKLLRSAFFAVCLVVGILGTGQQGGEVRAVTSFSSDTQPFTAELISAGTNHTCTVLGDSQINCWSGGWADNVTTTSYPSNQIGISDAVDVSAGNWHSCAVRISGEISCWGENYSGQLGIGVYGDKNTPTPVAGISNATKVKAGYAHTCALLATKTVKCWGGGTSGQLGNGARIMQLAPVDVDGLSEVIELSTGSESVSSCAIKSNFSLWCWGRYSWTSAGVELVSSLPVEITGVISARKVSIGSKNACAVQSTGTVKCWGWNNKGQLGDGTLIGSLNPVAVNGIANAIDVSVGAEFACALLNDGTVKCWGANAQRTLGNGTSGSSATPTFVESISNAVSIDSGNLHTCVVLQDKKVKCWGGQNHATLGRARSLRNLGNPGYVQKMQSITFADIQPKVFGDAEFTVQALSSSGLQVKISSQSRNVCQTSGVVVLIIASGTCGLIASQTGNEFFQPATIVAKSFEVSDWSGSRSNAITAFKVQTSDGRPVSGVRVLWNTVGAENPASGSVRVTSSAGTAVASTISGPALIRVVSLYEPNWEIIRCCFDFVDDPMFRKAEVSQFLYSYMTVKNLGSSEIVLDVGPRPSFVSKVFSVRLSDGTPVRGAKVNLAVTTNIWDSDKINRTFSGQYKSVFAEWHTGSQVGSHIGNLEPCVNDGNSFADGSGTNAQATTDENGNATIKLYVASGTESLITACYNDSEFTQARTVPISTTGTTAITLGYMAKVNVSVSSLSVASGGSESVSAQVVDANGIPVSSQSVQVMAGSVDSSATPLTCAGSRGTTNVNGRVTLNICPSASGNYFLRSNGALSSRLIYVTVGSASPANSSGGSSSPAPKSGGGGGGGDDEEDAAPVVAAPKSTPTTTTTAPRIIAAPKPASVPVMPAKAGVVVPNVVQPKATVAQGLAIAASSNSLTVALKAPVSSSAATKITSYVVTMRSSTGAFIKRVVVPVKSSGQTVAPSFKVAKAGNYVIEISGRNSKGKSLGTYKSAPVKVGK